jgi:sulfite exporter TauE/SafE
MITFATDAFLLGISTGIYCFSQCGLVLIPYIFAERESGLKRQSLIVSKFLLGRFAAYTATGLLIGFLGERANAASFFKAVPEDLILGISYIALSSLLIYNSIRNRGRKQNCRYNNLKRFSYFPVLLGIFTGLNICPPFILAITKSFETKSILFGTLFFIIFFIATSVYILPLIFTGFLKKMDKIRVIARYVTILAGIYLAIQGSFSILNTL